MNYDAVYVNPAGKTPRKHYVPAMITVLAVIGFYALIVPSLLGIFVIFTLLYPAFVLLVCRVRDMGYPVWLVLVPLALMLATFANQLGYVGMEDTFANALQWLAYVSFAAFILRGSFTSSRT